MQVSNTKCSRGFGFVPYSPGEQEDSVMNIRLHKAGKLQNQRRTLFKKSFKDQMPSKPVDTVGSITN